VNYPTILCIINELIFISFYNFFVFFSVDAFATTQFYHRALSTQTFQVEMVEQRLSVANEIEKELNRALLCAEMLWGSILKNVFEGNL
jgi:hypothetical protein